MGEDDLPVMKDEHRPVIDEKLIRRIQNEGTPKLLEDLIKQITEESLKIIMRIG